MPFYHPQLDNHQLPENKKETVSHPDHYLKDSGHEVIDVISAWNLNFNKGNAIKYIARSGKKDPAKTIEDLEKAIFYLSYEISSLKKVPQDE